MSEHILDRGSKRKAGTIEDFDQVHPHPDVESSHDGIVKTSCHETIESDDGITRLLERCSFCLMNTNQDLRLPLKSIVALRVGERMQVDLIDLRTSPSGPYKWIMHLKDHFSIMSFLWPLESKDSGEIAEKLSEFIETTSHIEILHCGDEEEFKGPVTPMLRRYGVAVVNIHPHHPQSQGLVARANRVVKKRLTAWEASTGRSDWHNVLYNVIISINCSPCRELPGRTTPYEVYFGRKPLLVRAERIWTPLNPISTAIDAEAIADAHSCRSDRVLGLMEVSHPSLPNETVESESEDDQSHVVAANYEPFDYGPVRLHQARLRDRYSDRYDTKYVVHVFKEGEFCFVAYPKNLTIATPVSTFMAKVLSCRNNLFEVLLKWGPLDYRVPVADMRVPLDSHIPEIREYLSDAPNEPKRSIRYIARQCCAQKMRNVECSCLQKCLPNRCA